MRLNRPLALLHVVMLVATVSHSVRAQPRPGQLPHLPPANIPKDTRPVGTAPTALNGQADGGWAAIVEYSPAPWATGHSLLRASAAGGDYREVARDTNPGPALARQRGMEARGIVMAPAGRTVTIAGRTTTSTGSTPQPLPRYTLRDPTAFPEGTFYYKVTAWYRDSAAATTATAAPVTTDFVNIPGLTASVGGSQTVLTWDTLPARPTGYEVFANGARVSDFQVFNYPGGKKVAFVNGAVDVPVSYEVRGWYSEGGRVRGLVRAEPKPVVGFADFHTHQFASVGFGGGRLPMMLHDQITEDELRSAYTAGLRLMVVLAVNTERPCEILAGLGIAASVIGGVAPTMSCDDSSNIDRQLAAAHAFEARVEAEDPAPGSGFYRIVTTPADARAAIRQGKLAVVLGIEVDNVFGCGTGMAGNTACTVPQMLQRMDRWRAAGVRQVNLVHLTDNGFGGMGLYDDLLAFNSYGRNGVLPTMRDCSASGVTWRFGPAVASDDVAQKAKDLAALAASFSGPVAADFIKGYAAGIPKSSAPGMCNARGLTPLGERALNELMDRKMIIDIDHMSQLAIGRALQLTAMRGYPVIAAHSGLLEASVGNKAAEGQRSPTQIDSLRRGGGALAIISHQGNSNEIAGFPGSVASNCNGSTKEWAQVYQWAVNRLGGPSVAAVGIGSDFNGIDKTVMARFGDHACDDNATQKPLQQNPTGNTEFDTKGLANIGLYGAFIQDLKNVGLTDAQLAPFMRSAEAYIEAWERAEDSGVHP